MAEEASSLFGLGSYADSALGALDMEQPEMNKEEGQRIDQFLECKVIQSPIVTTLVKNFDELECKACNHIVAIVEATAEEMLRWRYDLMGLRPNRLRVATAICPICQEMEKTFH